MLKLVGKEIFTIIRTQICLSKPVTNMLFVLTSLILRTETKHTGYPDDAILGVSRVAIMGCKVLIG